MKIFLPLIFISLIQINPFDVFFKDQTVGWSYRIEKNKLLITRDSLMKIQHFNYGMEANPPIIEHKYTIIIEYSKRLSCTEIETRVKKNDSIQFFIKKNLSLILQELIWLNWNC